MDVIKDRHTIDISAMFHDSNMFINRGTSEDVFTMARSNTDTKALVERVLYHIAGTDVGDGSIKVFTLDQSDCRRLYPVIARLISRLRRCHPSALMRAKFGTTRSHSPHSQVVAALRSLTKKVMPVEFVGRRRLDDAIMLVVTSSVDRKTRAQIPLGCIVRGRRLCEVSWLRSRPFQWRRLFFVKMLVWSLHRLVIDVLKRFFFVTRLCWPRYQSAFFFKPTWQALTQSKLATMLAEGSLRLTSAPVDHVPVTSLRFVWKSSGGLRPIAAQSIDAPARVIRQIRAVLKYLERSLKEVYRGRSKLSEMWAAFVDKYRDRLSGAFYVRVDIRDAFGSILHERLLEIIEKQMRIHLKGKIWCSGDGTLSRHPQPRAELLNKRAVLDQLRKAVCSAHVQFGRRCFRMARGLLQGYPLSCSLSSIYYGAAVRSMCSTMFQPPRDDCTLLVRHTDDILLVTGHEHVAQRFLNVMSAGSAEFNCYIQPTKTRTNLSSEAASAITHLRSSHRDHQTEQEPHQPALQSSSRDRPLEIQPQRSPDDSVWWVEFVGSALHVRDGYIRLDYSRYSSVKLRYTMLTSGERRPGVQFSRRLRFLATQRLEACVCDPRRNRSPVLRRALRSHVNLTTRRVCALLVSLDMADRPQSTKFFHRIILFVMGRVFLRLRAFARAGGYPVWADYALVKREFISAFISCASLRLRWIRRLVRQLFP